MYDDYDDEVQESLWPDRWEYKPLEYSLPHKVSIKTTATGCVHQWEYRTLFTSIEKYCIKCQVFERS